PRPPSSPLFPYTTLFRSIILPVDAIVAFHFEANTPSHAYGVDAIPAEGMMLDVGGQSIERIKGAIDEAATLVWNGPFGAFELHRSEEHTSELQSRRDLVC